MEDNTAIITGVNLTNNATMLMLTVDSTVLDIYTRSLTLSVESSQITCHVYFTDK